MKRANRARLGAALVIFAELTIIAGCFGAAARPAPTFRTSSLKDRKALSVTVYTTGAAMVRDTRAVEMPASTVELKFSDVARQLLPDSVRLASVTAPGGLTLLGQTYAYDPLSPERLLQAYVGKTLTVVLVRRKNGSDAEEPVEAELLAANPGPVWRIGGKIETGLRADHYLFPEIPPDLSATPSLIFEVKNQHAGSQNVRVSYFTDGLSWSANYALEVRADWKTARMAARAAINNHSGVNYDQADLQLIAGEVRRVNEGVGYGSGRGQGMLQNAAQTVMVVPAPPPQQPFAGYHLYTFPEPVDVPNNAIGQVSLIGPLEVRVNRSYIVNGQVYYNQGVEPSSMLDTPVELHVKFDNTKANSLGEPLPGGIVRAYKADSAGREQLVGEDQLRSTASGETVDLDLGNAFDVVEKGKQTDYKRVGPNTAEAAYEITLRNHQPDAIVVTVNEPFTGDWQILSSSLPYEKTSSTSARFSVPVPANGSTVLKYQVRIQWVR